MLSGIKSTVESIWNTITDLFGRVGNYFTDLVKQAFNWGKNLISNIGDGIKNAWNSVVDGVKSVGQSISDFLGFGSPTKKGPGHYADEWIPNLMNMMANDMYSNMPVIKSAVIAVASTLSLSTNPTRAMVGVGTSPFGDLLNGLLATSTTAQMGLDDQREIVLQIDGQTFARLIAPKLTKEYKRNGMTLAEV